MLFKLPPIYTERVLALATLPFYEHYNIGELISRSSTSPYLSNRAEVKHVDLVTVGRDLFTYQQSTQGCPAMAHHLLPH